VSDKNPVPLLRWLLESTEKAGLPKVSLEVDELRIVIAALERADEVADQGCEYCDAMVTDMSEVGEPHGHWWKCGECANKDAIKTSTIIGHLSDLLDAALEDRDRLREEVRKADELLAGMWSWSDESRENLAYTYYVQASDVLRAALGVKHEAT
jgi:hypothetical protein